MRGKFIVALAISMATASAFAQTSSEEAEEATAAEESSSSVPSTSTAPAVPPNSSVLVPPAVTAPAPATATSTASLSEATKEVKERKVKGEYLSDNTISALDFKNSQNAPESANYLGVKYALSGTQSIGLRQQFLYNWPKVGTKGEGHIEDLYLNHTNTKVATFGGDKGAIQNINRLYFPTGETSRFVTKNRGTALTWWIASYSLGKFDFGFHTLGYYYNWSQDSFTTTTPEGQVKEVANTNYRLFYFPEVTYNVTDKLSLTLDVGLDNRWLRPVNGSYGRKQAYYGYVSASYQFVSQLALTVYVQNDVNVYDPQQDFAFYRDDETTYGLVLSGSI